MYFKKKTPDLVDKMVNTKPNLQKLITNPFNYTLLHQRLALWSQLNPTSIHMRQTKTRKDVVGFGRKKFLSGCAFA